MSAVAFLDRLKASPELIERFWNRLDKRGPHECWVWNQSATTCDYGRFRIGNNWVNSNRIAWALANDVDPLESIIRHSCDNRGCCNPAHLEPGTHADNAKDKMDRKRWRGGDQRGEMNGRARLTAAQVVEIVAALRTAEPMKSVGRRYGVTNSMISRIATGRAWVAEAAAAGWEPSISVLTATLPRGTNGQG